MPRPSVIYEVTHKPVAELDYGFNWNSRGWLDESPDDSIGDGAGGSTAPVWTLVPAVADEDDEATIFATTVDEAVTTAWVRDLTAGSDYYLTCKVTLYPSGRIDERSMRIRCRR